MKVRLLLSFVLLFCPLLFAPATVSAQSTDQASPTPITASELRIAGPKKNNQQYYYSFTGGPGEVIITLSVKARSYSTFVGIKVFDAEFNTLAYHNMSADSSSAGLVKKRFEVGEKQTLVLSFTSDSSLAECKIKLEGAVDVGSAVPPAIETAGAPSSETATTDPGSPGSPSTDTPAATENQTATVDQGTLSGAGTATGKNKAFTMSILDAVGQRFNIPASGKLRIEMKDGAVQEIDLTQVKKILIKQ